MTPKALLVELLDELLWMVHSMQSHTQAALGTLPEIAKFEKFEL